jgi:hypothetical protein
MLSKNNNKTVLATVALTLLSLSVASSIAISTPHYASAQGLLEGLEREQSGESVPGAQPADIGGPAPINATTTVEGGSNATNANVTGAGNATNANVTGAGNATNANVTGAGNATNATTTGDVGTTAGNETVSGPLALYGGGGG